MLPADLGAGVVLVLSGFGVASVLSALKPYPVPAAGDSPFSSPTGRRWGSRWSSSWSPGPP